MTLNDLIARVEKATGADRELDALICTALGATVEPAVRDGFGRTTVPAWWTMPGASREEWPHRTTPWPVTASVDAALALIERVAPGTCALISATPKRSLVNLAKKPLGEHGEWFPLAEAPTLPLALTLALLRSLETEHG